MEHNFSILTNRKSKNASMRHNSGAGINFSGKSAVSKILYWVLSTIARLPCSLTLTRFNSTPSRKPHEWRRGKPGQKFLSRYLPSQNFMMLDTSLRDLRTIKMICQQLSLFVTNVYNISYLIPSQS